MCLPGLQPVPAGPGAKSDAQKYAQWARDHVQQVRAQKGMRKIVLTGAGDHFQVAQAQKMARKNVFAKARTSPSRYRHKKTGEIVLTGGCNRFQQVHAQKVTRKNAFAGRRDHFQEVQAGGGGGVLRNVKSWGFA